MFRSSCDFARRCVVHNCGGRISGNKRLLSAANTALPTTRTSSQSSGTMLAMAGTAMAAGCYGTSINDDENHTRNLLDIAAPLNPTTTTTHCQANNALPKRVTRLKHRKTGLAKDMQDWDENPKREKAKLKRKKTVLKVAASLERLDTRSQISRLRLMKDEMLTRWERDEEGWRNLPARAWPEFQPNPQQVERIAAEIERLGCTTDKMIHHTRGGETKKTLDNVQQASECTKLLFFLATGLVFYSIDPEAGFALYERLAKKGHTDSMVACGIVLVEGLGIPPREHEGFVWLEKAMDAPSDDTSSLSSAQAAYELGTIYYTGIDGVIEEDPEKAFELFRRAAQDDHTAALYMVADCLVEGEGTEVDISKAVPLLYKAAERGHRYSRQRIRELLAKVDYPL